MPLKEFFLEEKAQEKRQSVYFSPQCGACGLKKRCRSPLMLVDGDGLKEIFIIGEGPGQTEDDEGRPFVGTTGQFLQQALARCDVDMRRDCWISNAVRCHPYEWDGKTKKRNRPPTDKEISYCRPFLMGKSERYGDIARLKPRVVILLGAAAVKSVLGSLWKEEVGSINRWAGWCIPCQSLNAWVCPVWHPSYVVREDKNRAVRLLWEQHLQAACSLKRRPWRKLPDYKSRITVEVISRQAAQYIDTIYNMGKPTAWDIEATTLKPDGKEAEIVSCALSNGTLTVSYPWHGEARAATLRFLQSSVAKIGYNMRMETRYLLAREGIRIKNWVWDGMIAAHVLDNRPGVTGLKFQAFVLLGQEPYNDAIEPFLKSDAPNKTNRIHDIPLRDLLVYGGMDALLEYEVAKVQSAKLGIDLFTDGEGD